ncbi:MAG: thiamine pyrophosphate-dependent enzyme [Terriglobia bacterium]
MFGRAAVAACIFFSRRVMMRVGRHCWPLHFAGDWSRLQLQTIEERQTGVAFFGDGAVNNGAFHEGLNLASIWKLPVLFFVCENNLYATGSALPIMQPPILTSRSAAWPTGSPEWPWMATT